MKRLVEKCSSPINLNLYFSVQDKPKGGTNKKGKAPKPPLQIKLNHAPAPPPPQSSQQQQQLATSFSTGPVTRNDNENKQSTMKQERQTTPAQEEINVIPQSKDKKASITNSSTRFNGKSIQTPENEKVPKHTATLKSTSDADETRLKSSLDVARKCRNEFPPVLTSSQELLPSNATTTTTNVDKIPKHTTTTNVDKIPLNTTASDRPLNAKSSKSSLGVARKCRNDFPPALNSTHKILTSNATNMPPPSPKLPPNKKSGTEVQVPEFQTLTLKKTPKERKQSNDPRFIPVKSPREELLSSIQNMGGSKMLKKVESSSASSDKKISTVESPREDLLSSIRNSQGLKSLKPVQESVTPSPSVSSNGPPPPPPPVPATNQPKVSQPSKFKANVDPRDDLLSAIRNSGGVKSLRPVKR